MASGVIGKKDTMPRQNPVAAVGMGIIFGLICAAAALLIISIAAVFYDIPDRVMNILIIIISAAAMFASGLMAAEKNRRNGLLIGVITGLVYSVVTLAAGIIFYKSVSLSPEIIADFAIGGALGGLGGIAGINRAEHKNKKRKHK